MLWCLLAILKSKARWTLGIKLKTRTDAGPTYGCGTVSVGLAAREAAM
jgi:hypothetical protein